jgi:hypothetical protein
VNHHDVVVFVVFLQISSSAEENVQRTYYILKYFEKTQTDDEGTPFALFEFSRNKYSQEIDFEL